MRISRILAVVLLAALASCGDSGLFNPGSGAPIVRLQLRPTFSHGVSSAQLVDIHRIRLTVTERPSGRVVLTEIQNVNPTATSWEVGLEVPPNASYDILIELINVTNGVESVQFSGSVAVSVTTGPQPPPPSVTMVPGPPENLRITSVAIAPRNQSLLETESVQLSATVGGVPNAQVIWGSANNNVATVDNTGRVTARAPGQATIFVQAGAHTDQITITVGARAERIELAPAATTLTSIGADATFTARVLDARGAVVPGVAANIAITDPSVAAQVSPGVFRALRNGTTTVTATATQGARVLNASAPLIVEQRAVTISIDPTTRTFESIGDTQQFTASARDANNNPLTGVAFTWTSSNAAVASVDANGVVTARGSGGPATIRVSNGGNSAEASVTVNQTAASITVTPPSVSLGYIGESVQATAVIKDARGNVMNVPVRWFVAQGPSVATVSETGEITAQGEGQAVVIADAGRLRAGVSVTVRRLATRMDFDRASLSLSAGQTVQVRARLYDAGGTPFEGETFTYSSANPSIATVNASGNVTGVSAGTTQIIATARGFEARLPVTVVGPAAPPPFTGIYKALVVSNRSYDNMHIIDELDGRMPTVTFEHVTTASALTPAYLAQFKVVLLFENGLWYEATPVGNAIAQYVQAGGNVVFGTFYWQDRNDNPYYGNSTYGWGTLETLDPWEAPAGFTSSTFYAKYEYRSATLDASSIVSHPLTTGVTALTIGSYPNGMEAKSGTSVVARYTNGAPLIGYRIHGGGQRMVAVAAWPAHNTQGSVSGDFWQVWQNALNWAAAGSTPTASASRLMYAPTLRVQPQILDPTLIGGSHGRR